MLTLWPRITPTVVLVRLVIIALAGVQFANLGTGTMDLLLDESKLSQAMELTQLDTTMARLNAASGRGGGGALGYMGTPMGTPAGTPHFTPG